MRMQKRKFRIGEFAKNLNVEKFVIRFWEKEFALRTGRSIGGQRFYNENDLALFVKIKELLYEQGFTIAGAKQQINTHNDPKVIASKRTDISLLAHDLAQQELFEKQKNIILNQLETLHKKLLKLQQLL